MGKTPRGLVKKKLGVCPSSYLPSATITGSPGVLDSFGGFYGVCLLGFIFVCMMCFGQAFMTGLSDMFRWKGWSGQPPPQAGTIILRVKFPQKIRVFRVKIRGF